jgi:hypothetical protein
MDGFGRTADVEVFRDCGKGQKLIGGIGFKYRLSRYFLSQITSFHIDIFNLGLDSS